MSQANRGMSAVRAVVGVVAIIAIIIALVQVRGKMNTRKIQQAVQTQDDKYFAARNAADFAACKQAYEAVLAQASSAEAKKPVEGRIAGCDAWIAFHETSDKPSINKYKDAIEKMKKASALAGDADGVWAKNVAVFEKRLDAAMGPKTAAELRARWDKDRTAGWDKTQSDILAIYRWHDTWHSQGYYVDDAERNKIFAEAKAYIIANYCREFEEQIAAAAKKPVSVAVKAAPLGGLYQVKSWAPEKVPGYEAKYAKTLAQSRQAQKQAEALGEKMIDPSTVIFKE